MKKVNAIRLLNFVVVVGVFVALLYLITLLYRASCFILDHTLHCKVFMQCKD